MNYITERKGSVSTALAGLLLFAAGWLWIWIETTWFEPVGVNFGPMWLFLAGIICVVGGVLALVLSLGLPTLLRKTDKQKWSSPDQARRLEHRILAFFFLAIPLCVLGVVLFFTLP